MNIRCSEHKKGVDEEKKNSPVASLCSPSACAGSAFCPTSCRRCGRLVRWSAKESAQGVEMPAMLDAVQHKSHYAQLSTATKGKVWKHICSANDSIASPKLSRRGPRRS